MMQKKFEKLPGLSNVSGKYTKKNPSDSYTCKSSTSTFSDPYEAAFVNLERKASSASSGVASSFSSKSMKHPSLPKENPEVRFSVLTLTTDL